MAKNLSLATYKSKGSAGLLTFSNWKGISYFKQKATTVANPKTDAQVNQRARLTAMVELFRQFATVSLIGFREKAIKMSSYNAFVKYNIQSALTYVSLGVYNINWGALKVSQGTLGTTLQATSSASAATNNATVTFDTGTPIYGQSVDDKVMIAYFNSTTEIGGWNVTSGQVRSDGTVTFAIEGGVTLADHIYIYLFFTSPDGSKVSDSDVVLVTAGA